MSIHTILEALADGFKKQHDDLIDQSEDPNPQTVGMSLHARYTDLRLRAKEMGDISNAIRHTAEKLKPAEPEVNVEKELEKPI